MATASELPIDRNATATEMANAIFGDGVTVVSASYTGDNRSSGIYSDGDATSGGVTPSDTGVILSTGRVQDFTNSNGGSNTNQSGSTSRNTSGENNNADFNALAGTNTYDASYIDVDFIPTSDLLTMQFVFASEEYPEYSGSIYNDAVGVWINGTLVPVEISGNTTSVGNVNQTDNVNLYNSNTGDQFNTEMDGFTVTMTVKIPVNAGQVNSIRIGIADVTDNSYDSSLLIAGDSIQNSLIAQNDSYWMTPSGTKTVDLTGNDLNSASGSITVTHINGQAVSAGSTVTLATGQQLTLNGDGSVTVVGDGDQETISFTYGIENSSGQTDTGFVTLDTVPCFVAGTMILTDTGEVCIDDLEVGDLVMTHDDGPRPLRWIGRRKVPATGNFAPILIEEGTFGPHGTLMVSPQHRILIKDVLAELLFGENEVLVAAKDLINDSTIRRIEGGRVEYVHLLFDKHQVVYSEGLATESFLVGPQTTTCFEADLIEEILTLFPELDPETGSGYFQSARRTLRAYEAQVLIAESSAA